jgi:hypothetical protein
MAWRSAHEGARQRASSGHHFRVSTANAPCVIRTFGTPIKQCYRPNVIVRLGKTVAKPIISSGSTTRCANAVAGWCVEHSRFRKRWPIISARSGISSMTIMHGNARNLVSLHLHDYPLLGAHHALRAIVVWPQVRLSLVVPPVCWYTGTRLNAACIAALGRQPHCASEQRWGF